MSLVRTQQRAPFFHYQGRHHEVAAVPESSSVDKRKLRKANLHQRSWSAFSPKQRSGRITGALQIIRFFFIGLLGF
jgi:hypothetical protein